MTNRRKKRQLFLPVLLCLLLLTGGATAYGAEAGQAEVSLPVEQKFLTENAPEGIDGSFLYRLEAEGDEPLPEGAKKGAYDFTLTGDEKSQVGPIRYADTGVYRYTMYQVVEKEKDHYIYDRQTYQVRVYVSNVQGGGLSTQVVMENEAGKKTESGAFTNRYKGMVPAPGTGPVTPGASADKPADKTSDGAKTGDDTAVSAWILAACLSGMALLVILRRKPDEKDSGRETMS